MKNHETQFNQLLETYHPTLKEHIQFILQNSGRLDPKHCRDVMETMEISAEDLMVKMLPVAELYVKAPISNFNVGAVARARMSEGSDEFALFMGANIEFAGLALTQTIHAEQAVVMNAWLQGAVKIDAVAVSAFPCGRCRQFLSCDRCRPSVTSSRNDTFARERPTDTLHSDHAHVDKRCARLFQPYSPAAS